MYLHTYSNKRILFNKNYINKIFLVFLLDYMIQSITCNAIVISNNIINITMA